MSNCAKYHCDQHVLKMLVEYTQILMTTHHLHGKKVPWRPTHVNHPCVRWAASSRMNYLRLLLLTRVLGIEYSYRWHKRHMVAQFLYGDLLIPPMKDGELTPPPLCMPDNYIQDHGAGPWGNAVFCYRNYYLGAKLSFATWKRGMPEWVRQMTIF